MKPDDPPCFPVFAFPKPLVAAEWKQKLEAFNADEAAKKAGARPNDGTKWNFQQPFPENSPVVGGTISLPDGKAVVFDENTVFAP